MMLSVIRRHGESTEKGRVVLKLDLHKINIKGVEWGNKTTVNDGVLYVNRDEAITSCGEFPAVAGFSLHLARPGESVRIIPVKAAIEPRCKITGEGAIFPGIVGGMEQAGIGATLALKNCAVLVTESGDDDLKCRTGGLVDMSGPAAEYTPFSKTFNIVLEAHVKPEILKEETLSTDEACRFASFRLAVYLAECCAGVKADEVASYELMPADEELPGVVYVMQLLSQNPEIIDFHVYGQLAGTTLIPTILHPNEILDGAVTTFLGAHCTVCSDKQYMYEVQNSPVVEEFFAQHGKRLRFLGVILHNEVTTLEGKHRASLFTAKLAKLLGAKGAVLVTEGHGNPDEDIMLNVKNLEEAGIRTVIISDELGGRDGKSPGLADWVPECDAMVSVGNTHQLLAVPEKLGTLIGNPASLALVRSVIDRDPEDPGCFYTELIHIPCSCAQAGIGRLSADWI